MRSRAIRLLHLDYKPQRYYWEVIEILRKLFLIGFSTLVYPGTYIQLLFAISISVVALGLHLAASPYRSTSDNLLAGGLLMMTLSFFFSAVLLKAPRKESESLRYPTAVDCTLTCPTLLISAHDHSIARASIWHGCLPLPFSTPHAAVTQGALDARGRE